MTLKQLEARQRRLDKLQAAAQQAAVDRDEAILALLDQHSHADLARTTGLSRGRIGQLALRRAA